jgi:hypothetical protein
LLRRRFCDLDCMPTFHCKSNMRWMLQVSGWLRSFTASGNAAKISLNDLKHGRLTIVRSSCNYSRQ